MFLEEFGFIVSDCSYFLKRIYFEHLLITIEFIEPFTYSNSFNIHTQKKMHISIDFTVEEIEA